MTLPFSAEIFSIASRLLPGNVEARTTTSSTPRAHARLSGTSSARVKRELFMDVETKS